jgi:exodeoxyribonuclease (lambda-induced)
MKFIECAQGTPEWHAARCGKVTASRFADAISTVGGLDERQAKYVAMVRGGMEKSDAVAAAGYKAAPSSDTVRRALLGEDTAVPSDIAKRYAADLAIERISGSPFGEPPRAWVLERGHKMEELARMHYEARKEALVTEAGICLTDDELFGYSSDGLVDEDGLIEVKAPIDSAKIMEMWLTEDMSEYMHQMQGGMWITGRKWCDFLMYVPDLAPCGKDLFVKRVLRDDAFIDDMVARLAKFDDMVKRDVAIFWSADEPKFIAQEAGTPAAAPAAPGADWRTAFLKTAA